MGIFRDSRGILPDREVVRFCLSSRRILVTIFFNVPEPSGRDLYAANCLWVLLFYKLSGAEVHPLVFRKRLAAVFLKTFPRQRGISPERALGTTTYIVTHGTDGLLR